MLSTMSVPSGSTRPVPKKFQPEPFPYHQELELEITSLTNLGIGVGRVAGIGYAEGWVVMVPFALPEERVVARVWRNHKTYSNADLVRVLRASPHRGVPRCDLFGQCGGCQYQHLTYEAQLEWKTAHVADVFARIAEAKVDVAPAQGSPEQYFYRSKLTPHFQRPRGGEVQAIGFVRHDSRRIVDVEQCPIATRAINEALPAARQRVHERAGTYKKGGTLLLRDVVTNRSESEREGNAGDVITDPKAIACAQLGPLRFSFRAGEFFQNNPFALPAMVDYAVREARGLDYPEPANRPNPVHLVDAYCGVGVFALSASRYFERVVGVEISEAAIEFARSNASHNNIQNCDFRAATAHEIFAHLPFGGEQASVILDPPRKGCDPEFLAQLVEFAPARIVYVSCDPATQARDVKELLRGGYRLVRVQPFDLFPQTRHIESVATLVKNR